jgi:hypothetical protein
LGQCRGVRRFDNQGEEFYNQISAIHKSVRGSSPDAALYWFCRMLDEPLSVSLKALSITLCKSSSVSAFKTYTLALDNKALFKAKDGFSVVAPKKN